MKMRLKERIASVCILALFLFAFFYSRKFPAVPKMLPTFITVAGGILCIVLFIQTFFKKYADEGAASEADAKELPVVEDEGAEKAAEKTAEELADEKKKSTRNIILSALLLAGYIIFLKFIGFYVTSFLFILALSYLIEGKGTHPFWMYPVVAVGILLVIWAIFSLFLKVPLPKGFLF